MNTRTISLLSFVALVAVLSGCGRYSFALRRSFDRGRYGDTVARCENDAAVATQQWNPAHQARYHVYCGMAYLNLGDTERAASDLVVAEHMRLANPRLITGRDLERLSQGLVQLFGVPAGQLEIQEGPGALAQAPQAAGPPNAQIGEALSPEQPPAPPAEPGVTITAGAGTSVDVAPAAPPAVDTEPEPPAAPPVSVDILGPAAPPPVIVIPPDDAAVIE